MEYEELRLRRGSPLAYGVMGIACSSSFLQRICIGNHMGLSAIFKKLHSNPCGYLLIIRHLANNNQ